jgi:hypothetical protein
MHCKAEEVAMSRPRIRFSVGLLLVTATLEAQVPMPAESWAHRDGTWSKQITNQYTSEIIAFEAKFICAGGGGVTYDFDSLVNYGHDSPIAPEAMQSFNIPDKAAQCNEVSAVVYANGEVGGDAKLLDDIRQHHKGVYDALQEVIPKLAIANDPDYDPAALASFLTMRAAQVLADTKMPVGERWGRHQVFYVVAHSLTDQHEIHVPSDDTPQRVGSMTKTAKTLNVSLVRAHAINLTQRLEEWRNDLAPEMAKATQ